MNILYINSLSPSVRLSFTYLLLLSNPGPFFFGTLFFLLFHSFSFFLCAASFSLTSFCFHLTASVIMWIGWILLGPENNGLWLVEHNFSASGENHTHTHPHTLQNNGQQYEHGIFWALAWLVDCGFWATGQPKKNVTIGPLDHRCARCRARPTLKDVANWNYKTGLFFTIRKKDILNH